MHASNDAIRYTMPPPANRNPISLSLRNPANRQNITLLFDTGNIDNIDKQDRLKLHTDLHIQNFLAV